MKSSAQQAQLSQRVSERHCCGQAKNFLTANTVCACWVHAWAWGLPERAGNELRLASIPEAAVTPWRLDSSLRLQAGSSPPPPPPPLPPHFPLPFQSLSNSGSLAAFLSSVAAGRLRWPESVPWSCGQSSWDCLAGGRTSAGAEVSEKKNPQQPYLFHLSYHPFILSLSFSFPLSHPLLTLSLPPLPFSSSSIFFTSFFLLSPPTHSLSFSPWFGGWRLTMNYMATRETDSSRQICS